MTTPHRTSADPPSTVRPVALVVGASRGLGLLLAEQLGRHGYILAVCSRDPEAIERTADHLRHDGASATPYALDVGDAAAVGEVVERVEDELGPIEVALHVAGTIQVGPLESLEHSHFEEAFATMAWGPVNLALALVPRMRSRGHGHFGVVTSVGGLVSVPHLLPYSTAKFAAVGFTNGLRAELAGTGVSVTTIAPGLMRTGSHLRAELTGDQGSEYAWFAPGASLPLVSMDAERAARRIVSGVLRGRAFVVLTPLAQVGSRVAGAAPTITSWAMSLMARALPSAPDGRSATVPGFVARRRLGSRTVNLLTTLGDRAGRRTLETGPEA
ncbi:MAG: SDR family NAD(P)-dependent oxidoreductase [Actinomycetota bacterium]|nr:SDR family NAD(P)-dependent oxidoreductase [Actinomycetota bacterium]